MPSVMLFVAVGAAAGAAPNKDYYPDADTLLVERHGKVVDRLPVERIRLEFPELTGRGEGNVALDSKGNIWATVSYNTPNRGTLGAERLFRSSDKGKTWSSQILLLDEPLRCMAFTVLSNDSFLLVAGVPNAEPETDARSAVQLYTSTDQGKSWQPVAKITSEPFTQIGKGALSVTQMKNGTILLPITRWTGDVERTLLHSVFVSKDHGRSFAESFPTFPSCYETQIIELDSGRLLGAFRHQRKRLESETAEEIKAMGGSLDREYAVFKHVFLGDSDDGGKTWNNFRPLRDRDGRPLLTFGETHGQLVQVPDGRVVLVHDRRYPYEQGETRARVSQDGGKTWEPELYHLCFGHGYPSSVALADGTIVTVTGSTPYTPTASDVGEGEWRTDAIRWRLPE